MMPTPAFAQRDPCWAGQLLGATAWRIAQAGDLVTAAADMAVTFGRFTDPGRLNAWLTGCAGYTDQGQLYYEALAGLGIVLLEVLDADGRGLDLARVGQALAQGHGCLAELAAPAPRVPGRHWARIAAVEHHDCQLADPWQPAGAGLVSLCRNYGLPGTGAECLLKHALIYAPRPERTFRFGLPVGLHQVALNVLPPGPARRLPMLG